MRTLYWRLALSTKPCHGCRDASPHNAHLTSLARFLLSLRSPLVRMGVGIAMRDVTDQNRERDQGDR